MLVTIALLLPIVVGGTAITYLLTEDEPMLWRIAAGSIIGQCVFGTAAFLFACVFGLNGISIVLSFAVALVPMALFFDRNRKHLLHHDWQKAKGKLEGASLRKSLPFFYYLAFLILFVLFFDRAMIVNDQGIFTGGSQNLGDLPFHLGIIFSFVDGANFPPQNPSFVGAKFAYPFVPDLITAVFVKLGIGVRDAMFVLNMSWAFSLLVILEGFVFRLVNDRLAARLAPILLFLTGGLGFLWFFSDLSSQQKGLFEFLWHLPNDYTIGDEFRWGNSMITLFLTQRSLLLGMPLTLIVLGFLWKIFNAERQSREGIDQKFSIFHFPLSIFVIGVLAGLLPLIHLHSLFVLFVVTAFLFAMQPVKWREWMTFGAGVCLTALPELIWSVTGSASHASQFFEPHFGWDSGETNIMWFWIKNTGLLFPLLAAGIYLVFSSEGHEQQEQNTGKKGHKGKKAKRGENSSSVLHPLSLLKFYIPFAFIFVLANAAKLAPWEWDNIKVLIYWFVGSIPFVALVISRMWHSSAVWKLAAALCFVILIASGSLDVWRTISRQINIRIFDADSVTIANRLKAVTPPRAVFLNTPTYNTAIVLTGRQSVMRYPGHLSSHGIDYKEREAEVKQMYRGGPNAVGLLEKYGVEYVLVSPEERNSLSPNEAFFARFPVVAEAGQYKVYKVGNR